MTATAIDTIDFTQAIAYRLFYDYLNGYIFC